MTDELWSHSATQVVGLLQSGQVSPKDLVEVAAARIEQTNGIVNSIATTCFDRALNHADAIAKGDKPKGLLHGLPVVVKDLDAVSGVRTTYGSPIYATHVPDTSSAAVQALESQGAIVIAKSNTPEFGAGANTFNPIFGTTVSPWNTSKTCGGSSGGSAVALATGQGWLATGSDLGGSLRIPAAFCGVVGLRPSAGRVPRWPYATPDDKQDVTGPMARTVADLGLMLDAMSAHDARDPVSIDSGRTDFATAARQPVRPKRIAYAPDLGGTAPVDPQVRSVCDAAIERWRRQGISIDDECPDFSTASATFQVTRAKLMASLHASHYAHHKEQLKPDLLGNIEQGLALTDEQIAQAQANRDALISQTARFFESHDLLVTPTVMVPPFDASQRYVTECNGVPFGNYIDWVYHTFALTLTGYPAISVPCGLTDDGLPIGMQLVGADRAEATLLSFAAAFEADCSSGLQLPIDPAG